MSYVNILKIFMFNKNHVKYKRGKKKKEFNMSRKSILLLAAILLVFGSLGINPTFAQAEESGGHKFAFGIGPEINMHSPEGYAGGLSLNFDYNLPIFQDLPSSFAAGLAFIGSNNFKGISVLEPSAFFRWYFLNPNYSGFFAQLNVGGNIILIDGESNYEAPISLVSDFRGGYRMPVTTNIYIEPYLRAGYPVLWGGGLICGLLMPLQDPPNKESVADRAIKLFEEKGIKDTNVVVTDVGVRITFENLHFLPDSAVLVREDLARIREVGKVISEIRNAKLLIAGHAARAGNLSTLQQLSLDRANYVARYLVRTGSVRSKNITTVGYGYSRPIASNDTEAGQARNRRVEIYILLED